MIVLSENQDKYKDNLSHLFSLSFQYKTGTLCHFKIKNKTNYKTN